MIKWLMVLLLLPIPAWATVTEIGTPTTGTGSGTTCTVSSLPSGAQVGDFLFATIWGNGGAGQTVSDNASLASLGANSQALIATGHGVGIYMRGGALGTLPSSVTFTISANTLNFCRLNVYRGLDNTPTKDPAASNPQSATASSVTISLTGLTTVNAGDLLVYSQVVENTGSMTVNSWTAPTNPTAWSDAAPLGGTNSGYNEWDNIWTSSGATGAVSATANVTGGTNIRGAGALVILQAAAVASGGSVMVVVP